MGVYLQRKNRYNLIMRIYSYSSKLQQVKKKAGRKFSGPWNWKKILTWLFRLFAAGILVIAFMFLYYSRGLPDPNKLLDRQVAQSTKIYARDGSLLYEIHGEAKRTKVDLSAIALSLQHATVAVEDKDFYHHGGISVTGIGRAILVDITTGKKTQGGSTITQQFVKKAILTDDKSWDRKIREGILAIAIDTRFTKDQILNFYLNEIPYGRNAYGIEAAAQTYFNKSAKDLDLAESAYLAGMPQAPTYYNPSGPHRDALDARKNTILTLMQQQGYITETQAKDAKNEKVNFSDITTGIVAPHFVLWVQDYLAQKYGEKTLEEGGLKVTTTLDPKLQNIAEQAVKDGIAKEEKKYNVNNAALVAVDPKTGQILAMVGSKDYFGTPEPAGCTPGKNCLYEPNVNVAVAQRQPGSSFKPYVYLTAFKKQFGYTPASPLFDVVTNFGTFAGKSYIPHNYSGEENGLVNMRKALAGSLNIPAVKTLALVGVENATQTARDLGITTPLQNCGLSLVLGGCEVRLIDHVAAFAAIANEGSKHDKTAILKIEDSEGKTLEEYQEQSQQVVDPEAAYELISIMTDNNARQFVFGSTSANLTLSDRMVAAKTGTTQNWHDGWTIGFTPSLAAGVWAGNNDGTLLKKGADGVLVAAPIWKDFMQKALAGTVAETFTVPSGIQQITVDDASGKLPTQYSPSTHVDTFADYSAPKEYDTVHQNIAFDSLTGQPANALTPPGQINYRVCANYQSEKPDNGSWEGPVRDWAATQPDTCPTASGSSSSILMPTSNSSVQIEVLDPVDGTTITRTPFIVTISATSPNSIVRVDLSIDGKFYKSNASSYSPYTFSIDDQLPEGHHTIAAKAVDSQGQSADTSVLILYNSQPSNTQDPASNSN